MVQDTLRASRKALVRFAETMADVVDARNTFTRGHSRRTADLARRIAGWLGLDEGHADLVRLAALWHNLGSLGVPKRIIAKPDILTLEERDLLYQHPVTGREIVSRLPGLEPVAAWIAAHHERPDGKGYPEMLEGGQVPLESRIVAAADVYEALTADRPYRPAMPRDQALLVVEGLAGAQLDPVVVEALKAVV
ncbi:MAG TPA: HD domain-containing phosphohydrolase [Dehalococcoidia bacterium]